MKKALLLSIVVLLSNIALAQNVNLGVKLGITNSKLIKNFNGGPATNSDGYTNVDISAFADIKYNNFTIQPGIGYYLKGGGYDTFYLITTSSPSTTSVLDRSLRLYYLEVPVNAIYNIPVKAGKIFIGAGPYVALAVAGKMDGIVTQGNGPSQTTTSDVSFGSNQIDFKRMDYGINVLGGFRFNNRVELGVGYGFGLQNLSNIPNFSVKNASGTLTVGYFFK